VGWCCLEHRGLAHCAADDRELATCSCSRHKLEAALGFTWTLFGKRLWGRGGAAKLESMNAKNLLLRHAYDPLARDIDAAAFGPKLKDVYTLPSSAHVLAARMELDVE
jgi:hypothetical protein